MIVEVRVDSEESPHNRLDGGVECLGEGHADLAGEDGFVVQHALNPVHELVDVLCSQRRRGSWAIESQFMKRGVGMRWLEWTHQGRKAL